MHDPSSKSDGSTTTEDDDAVFGFLLECVAAAPSADNSQPWCIERTSERSFSIRYATRRVEGLTFLPGAPATLLAIGAVIENVAQAAKRIAVAVQFDLFPTKGDENHFASVSWSGVPSSLDDLTSRQIALFRRHTNRNPFQKTPLPAAMVSFVEGETELAARAIVSRGEEKICLVGLLKRASGVRFRTREVHEWLASSLRFTVEEVQRGDGLDVNALALPPGGKAFMRALAPWSRMHRLNRIGLFRLMAVVEAGPVRAAPGLISIVSQSDPASLLAAGRLLERLWIGLNEAGLSVHPYYVVSDQLQRLAADMIEPALKPEIVAVDNELKELLNLEDGELVQIMLRVGYCRRDAKKSMRIPVSELLCS